MNTSVIIAVVILYEIVSIGGCALYLKMKERKNKGGQAAAGDDFSTGITGIYQNVDTKSNFLKHISK